MTQVSSHSIGCVYVDDTDIYTAGPLLTTVQHIISTAMKAVPQWSLSLSAPGGAIKGSKSGWYLIACKYVDGIWVPREVPWDLIIPLPEPEGNVIIEQHKVTHAIKSLGVLTSPFGGHVEPLVYICDKVAAWLALMINGHLPVALSWMSY